MLYMTSDDHRYPENSTPAHLYLTFNHEKMSILNRTANDTHNFCKTK